MEVGDRSPPRSPAAGEELPGDDRLSESDLDGAGLQVSPNAVAVLRGIGLEDRLLNAGAVQAQAVRLKSAMK